MKINTKTIILIFLIFRGTSWGDEPSPWDIQAQQEKTLRTQGWMIPHKANYFFPYSYNTVPHSTSINRAQHQEAKYQFSLKILVSDNLFRSRANMFFGYTQLALWQLYDRDNSAPFRDINHEPEIFLSFDQANDLGFAILRKVDFGVSHQSNGTTYPDSRSWNRAYARLVLDRKNFSFALKPWIRIKVESNNDNPDIYKYLGYGELVCSYFLK
jgi:phospholipase A1